ncbi:MAG: tyrosine--tRNA ligase [Pseudomonadales bacterium]|nr:tyrosine--tRNA ligase [Pseudomonadales bacterium]
MSNALLDELSWRGLISQSSDIDRLGEHLDEGRTLYCGFDPTADSLHIGSLVPLLTLRRFQEMGHRPILVLGGATGLIGDPSFRDDERNLNSADIVGSWVESLRRQVEPFLSFEGECSAIIANNLDWTQEMSVISFLRDVGKHFSVNAMIQRESVKTRLERADQGISYTEFSYMLLQGMDYLELARRHDCTLQIGGSDQWGNIVSGVDLVRRELSKEVFAITLPLVTKADGTKFGKTAGGAVWIDPRKTSPYSFYQFWLNAADADVENYLKLFTFLSQAEVSELLEEMQAAPEKRSAQLRLAREVTRIVHGQANLESAERITQAIFGGELAELTRDDFEQLTLDGLDASSAATGDGLLSVMVEAGLAKSVGEARKLVQAGGVRINGEVVTDHQQAIDFGTGFYGSYLVLRRGKKVHHLLVNSKND